MLTKDDISAVARLAKLDLSDQEASVFQTQLSSILDLFKEIDVIDLEGVEGTSQITGISNVAYKDEVISDADINPSGADENLSNTPLRDGDKILTPSVIEK